ncbi:hypothetical protein [uncultured Mediterranean phage uvDeep-CGR2-AD8-C175]|nr:hypothetical protein [uncultured Mediterranean phage uvDeep-CGR2-AD8-C175]
MAYTTIDNPELYFQCKTYAGNGGTQSITFDGSEDMQANLAILKSRTDGESHNVVDSVRGVTKYVYTNTTGSEGTTSIQLTSFDSDGFSLGSGTNTNKSGENYVAWCWKESATAGFDIVAYTGTGSAHTISHSLSAVPSVVILKGRSFSDGWGQYHKTSGNPAILAFDGNVADRYSSKWSPFFNSTAPTSSVFSVGTDSAINTSSGTHIAYLFAEKQGFSKFSSFVGNNSNDGSYIYLGFRPSLVILKGTASNREWVIHDNKRDPANVVDGTLYPNTGDAEGTGTARMDFLSNGFKLREDGNNWNASGETYVYMAFAEQPFVNSNGVPANAR